MTPIRSLKALTAALVLLAAAGCRTPTGNVKHGDAAADSGKTGTGGTGAATDMALGMGGAGGAVGMGGANGAGGTGGWTQDAAAVDAAATPDMADPGKPDAAAAMTLVIAVDVTGVDLRNNFSGQVGMQITIGGSPISVTALGRYFVAGNTGKHILRVVSVAAGDVAMATLDTAAAGAADALGFQYAPLAAPVILDAGGQYYITSEEVSVGDQWYDYHLTATTTNAASIPNAVYNETSYITAGTTSNGYGPLNLKYTN